MQRIKKYSSKTMSFSCELHFPILQLNIVFFFSRDVYVEVEPGERLPIIQAIDIRDSEEPGDFKSMYFVI